MVAAVLRSQDALALYNHHRVSFDSAFTTPPPKPSRSTNRAERSSPSSPPLRSALKSASPSPANQAKPGRKVRLPAEESSSTRRSGGGAGLVAKLPGRNLVMGEVTILKRGDDPKAAPAPAPSEPAAPIPASPPAPARKPSSPAPARKPSPPAAARKPSPSLPAANRSRKDAAAAKADDVVFSSTERLGPEPEILPKQIRLTNHTKSKSMAGAQKTAVYAGSGFIASPSPSCLPFPTSFFAKKDLADKAEAATNTLKYLLRLDLA